MGKIDKFLEVVGMHVLACLPLFLLGWFVGQMAYSGHVVFGGADIAPHKAVPAMIILAGSMPATGMYVYMVIDGRARANDSERSEANDATGLPSRKITLRTTRRVSTLVMVRHGNGWRWGGGVE